MYVPTLAEKPESKPLYNSVRQVKNYERIAACIKGGKSGCTCYSDQATPIREVTALMCNEYAENGLPFDPFRDNTPPPTQQPQQQETTPENQGSVLSLTSSQTKPNLAVADVSNNMAH